MKKLILAAAVSLAIIGQASAACHDGHIPTSELMEAAKIAKQYNALSGQNENGPTVAHVIDQLECVSNGDITHEGAVETVLSLGKTLGTIAADPELWIKNSTKKSDLLSENFMRSCVTEMLAAKTLVAALNVVLKFKDLAREEASLPR